MATAGTRNVDCPELVEEEGAADEVGGVGVNDAELVAAARLEDTELTIPLAEDATDAITELADCATEEEPTAAALVVAAAALVVAATAAEVVAAAAAEVVAGAAAEVVAAAAEFTAVELATD